MLSDHDERAELSCRAAPRPGRPDRGATFVELLVSIVLIGTVVVATLTALRASVIGSRIDRDHARAYAWLDAGADAVDRADYRACHDTPGQVIVDAYTDAAEAAARPAGWETGSGATITVTEVKYLSRTATGELWGSACASGDPDSNRLAQRITLVVTSPDGRFTADLEVIKRD